jgi:hypothetical protein
MAAFIEAVWALKLLVEMNAFVSNSVYYSCPMKVLVAIIDRQKLL